MTRARLFAARIAGLMAGLVLSMAMVAPVAHADPIADIRGIVTRDRANTGCPELKYNQTLQDIGFATGQFIPDPPDRINGLRGSYSGEIREFIGTGNRQAQSLTDAYKKGAGPTLADCSFTDYGVSFVRYEPTETDWVGVILGKPSVTSIPSGPGAPGGNQKPAEQAPPVEQAPQTVSCPPGGPKTQVPAGQKCPPPANAVTVTFQRSVPNWTVNVKNNAGIGGSCHYEAVDTGGGFGAEEDFNIEPNGTASFQKLAPVFTRSYNVTTTCTGTYDGQQVQFGNDKQTIP